MDVSISQVSATFASLGLASHLGYFIRGEHQVKAPKLFIAALISPCIAIWALTHYGDVPLAHAARLSFAAWGSYLATVFASTLVYRAFFHPLRHYPGPRLAKLSQFYHMFMIRDKGDNYRYIHDMHAKYGEFVRIGPNLLSAADPDLVEPIHNSHSNWIKSEWYNIGWPLTTLHQMRDKALHDKRRRHGWDKAFTTKSLRSYDSRILKYSNKLIERLKERSGQALNASEWCMWYAFDVMGDLAFGRSFEALEKAESHFYIKVMHETNEFGTHMQTLTWLLGITLLLPQKLNPLLKLVLYSQECVEERQTRVPEEPDVMSHILEAGPFFHDKKLDKLILTGEARLLIVAGSDTTASTLTYILYNIAKHPAVAKKLREELEEHHVANDETFDITALHHLSYMTAVINETLRLHPPVPGGVFRNTPPEGATVGGHYLPGGVTVVGPHHTFKDRPRPLSDRTSSFPKGGPPSLT
jgi:cytochrome P450